MAEIIGLKRFALNARGSAALGLGLLVSIATLAALLGFTGNLSDPRAGSTGTTARATLNPAAVAAREREVAAFHANLVRLNADYAISAPVARAADLASERALYFRALTRISGLDQRPAGPPAKNLTEWRFWAINLLPGDDIENVPPYIDHNGGPF